MAIRNKRADALFELARRAAAERHSSWAMTWANDAARENPDHEAARRVLGYERFEGQWLTPYEASKARAKQVWHSKYGWLPRDRLARYEAGERWNRGRWTSAAEDARLHSGMSSPWEIATEHFQVQTDESLEAGVRLAERLERMYRVWQQVFVGYWASDAQVARWFAGAPPKSPTSRRHKVVYYRSRDEYVAALKPRQPRIEITTGYYDADTQLASFFVSEAKDDGSLFHEATHQLFGEVRPIARRVGRTANFWVVEGIACYMESLVESEAECLLGGRDAVRLRDAHYRLIEDGFYLPLSELVTLGMDRLQADERISMIYSEASGLTYFLMHTADGGYRDALVDYLLAIYTGRDDAGTLASLTGKSYRELDAEYRQFMADISLPAATSPATARAP